MTRRNWRNECWMKKKKKKKKGKNEMICEEKEI